MSRDRDGVTEETGRTRLEDVVAERSSEGAGRSAVVGSPGHASERDTDFEHVGVGDQGVTLDDGTLERSTVRREVDSVDTSERATVLGDDGVARNGRSESTEDDDT